ncbi:hypothetical protein ACEWY4_022004 [Coilia grayii]|uniref:Uncharacterized protein n=1 Tax=Coilia grayii TaxID=363190 RepID=A0ABD1J6B0_9TELE
MASSVKSLEISPAGESGETWLGFASVTAAPVGHGPDATHVAKKDALQDKAGVKEQPLPPPAPVTSTFVIKRKDYIVEPYKDVQNFKRKGVEKPEKTISRIVAQGAVRSAVDMGASAAERVLLHYGVGCQVSAGGSKYEESVEVHVAEVAGLKILSAGASAEALHASASATATPVGVRADATAYVVEVRAHASVVEDVLGAEAAASALKASAEAAAGLGVLGVAAGAEAGVVKAEVGIYNTPLYAHAKAFGAEAEAGLSWKYTGFTVGAHLGEAKAGPFAVRAGVKFGAGIRHGVPEVDVGLITIPCSVM